jgi:hypothetical protein
VAKRKQIFNIKTEGDFIMKTKLILASACLLLVTACSSRDEADRKMARGCEAGIRVLLAKENSDRQLDRVTSRNFSSDGKIRVITMAGGTKHKEYGYDTDETFSCRFTEEYSVGFIGWRASLQQIKIGETIFGKDNAGTLQGDLQDYINLTGEVDDAMK